MGQECHALVVMMWWPMKSTSVGVKGSKNRKLSVSMYACTAPGRSGWRLPIQKQNT